MGERYLIVGLGNPGERYRKTRHNLGAMVAEAFAEKNGWKFKRGWRLKGKVASGLKEDKSIYVLLPATYMNLSGQAVKRNVEFYKVPLANVLILVDDVNLPFGTLRLRPEGGTGGHKGLRDIEDQLHTEKFPRLRLGIGEIGGEKGLEQFVLEEFSSEQQQQLPDMFKQGVEVVECWLERGSEPAMQLAGNLTKEWHK